LTFSASPIYDVLIFVRQKFTILSIWDNTYSTALEINSCSVSRVYTVLEKLAEVGDNYFQKIYNNNIIYLLNERGIKCSGESSRTMEKYGEERVFRHRGESKQMEMHIKIGTKVRIYFDIDPENQKIIIGYCGKHLRTVSG
jgi:hypothetical protein